ncbi:MAG: hypothetical protein A2583_05520 [Bdellovibrionales bacterium RIFOXYD1_FULL_53_11]|nr:MAG: hypothetical protein A2583_05520 [Bdellovibrionales bacterium RIFOXYD1_FULL_53_11]
MHTKPLSVSVIIPVYNEERVIANTLEQLAAITSQIKNAAFSIICVDDGSTDDTGKILQRITGIKLITHPSNRGYGAALKTGINSTNDDWIFIVDADNTYPLQQLEAMIDEASAHDMVIGSRGGKGISFYPHKRLARWILRKIVHVLTGIMVPDLNSGMRLFKKSLYNEFCHLLPMGFSFTTTLTVASLYSGYRIKFIPINYSHRTGSSNIRPVKDFFGFMLLIIRLASYFEPLSFFIPISVVLVIIGILRGIRDIFVVNSIGSLSVIICLMGLQFFFTGVIADVLVRRSNKK